MKIVSTILGIIVALLFFYLIFKVYAFLGRLIIKAVQGPKKRAEEQKQKQIATHLTTIKAQAAELTLPAARCWANLSEKSKEPLESKLGGWPDWPKDTPLPMDTQGRPMVFLAQINFDHCPNLPDFPTTGLLQFFIQGDELYGLEAEPEIAGFQVVYHEDLSDLTPQDPYVNDPKRDLLHPFDTSFRSWRRQGVRITFSEADYTPSPEDFRLQDEINKLDRDRSAIDVVYDTLLASHERTWFNVGGHPRFTQSDIRQPGSDKTRCLLSIGYIDRVIMWGSGGEACFLISPEDLRAKRFDRAIYYWDCT